MKGQTKCYPPIALTNTKGLNRLELSLLLGALTALAPLSIDMYLPAFPEMAQYLNASSSQVQLSLTTFLLGFSFGQLFTGPLSDIYGRRKPLLTSLVIYVISSLLCAVSPSIQLLIFLRLIQGLSGAMGIVNSRAIVRDLYSGPEMTVILARLMLVTGAAPVLAPIAGGQLLNFMPWQGIFIVLALVGACLFMAFFLRLPETLPQKNRSQGSFKNTLLTLRKLICDRYFMGYALSQGFVTAAMFAYISGSPFVLQNIFNVSPQLFSFLFAINSLGIITASQISGKLAGSVSIEKLFVSGIGMSFFGGITLFIAILAKAGLYIILPPMFIVVASVGMVTTTGTSLAMQNQAKVAGSASGLLGVLSFVSGALVAPLVGFGGESTALPLGIVVLFCNISSILSYVLLVRYHNIFKKPGPC